MGGRTAEAGLQTRVQRLAGRGGDLGAVRVQLDHLLRSTIGYDVAALSTIDPATLLWTSCFISGLDHDSARERVVFDLEFEGGDLNHYRDLAQQPVPVGRLHADSGGDITRTRRYERLLEPLGVADEMRVVLRSREICWGTVTMYRRRGGRPFSERDQRAVGEAVTAMADVFRLALLRTAADAPRALGDPPGVLLVSADGSVRATTPAAAAWLDRLDDRGRLPTAVRVVAQAAAAGDGLARAALPARDGGWVELHSSVVKDEGGRAVDEIAVIVEGARPVTLSEVVADAYGLTARERDIVALVAQGRSNKQVAAALGISLFTVQDHLKAVFAKIGVESRGELVAALFAQQYEPRNASGARPSPYGWYLDDEVRLS